MSSQLISQLAAKTHRSLECDLFSRFGRSRRLCRGTFGRLVDLELFFQLSNQSREFFLPLGFDLLPERLLNFAAFLNVPRFKLGALLRIELKTGVTNCRFSLARHRLATQILSLTHEIALFGAHLHPNLGVAPEILARVRREREPSVPYALTWRQPTRPCAWRLPLRPCYRRLRMSSRHWRRSASCRAMLLRLPSCGSAR